jgi:3-deoxy-D-manno-octulosonic-acid transferase
MASAARPLQGRSRPESPHAVTWRVHPTEILYDGFLRIIPAVLRLAAPFHHRLRAGLRGRRASLPGLRQWAAAHRDDARPLLWLHAPSVGEALMAQAILAAARERAPHVQAVFTFFSPSAERMAGRVGADWHGYLPWDRHADVRAALDAVRPSCIAFVRTEIWPVLARAARARGSGVALVNAVLGEGSSRTGRMARAVLGPAYRSLDAVGAASVEDARLLPLLGVPPERISVAGDARFDQVWHRVHALHRDRPLLRMLSAGPGLRLVAGSTWPADEARLVAALAGRRAAGSGWRLIVAPHEPSPAHLRGLERRLRAAGLTHARLPDDHAGSVPAVDALVVDRVGLLADLYAIADAAYVGGGFGDAGLHSVVEPAALGVPAVFGPRHGNAREAARLAAAGGGFVVSDAAALGAALDRLRRDPACRARAASAARAFVEQHTGGAGRNADLLLPWLSA